MFLAIDRFSDAVSCVATAIPLLLAGRSAASSSSRWAAAARLAGGGVLAIAFGRAALDWWREWTPSWEFGVLGSVAAIWCGAFALLTHRPRNAWSSDAADRTTAIALLWVAAPDAVFEVFVGAHSDLPATFVNVGLVLGVVAPVGLAALALFRMVDRRRWLGLVADGKMPGWALVDTPNAPPSALPLVSGSDGGPIRLLARTDLSEHPFRGSGGAAVARVGVARKESGVSDDRQY
jgi:hypothetical protein